MFEKPLCQNEFEDYTLGDTQIRITKANRVWLYDQSGRPYIDFHNGYGTVILGYGNALIQSSVKSLFETGLYYVKAPTEYLFHLRDSLLLDYPDCGDAAFYTTGTSAVRAAIGAVMQAHQDKDIILSSGFHGWDPMWESSDERFKPNKYGVIDFFFLLDVMEDLIQKYRSRIACVIISPDLTYFSDNYFKLLASVVRKYGLILIDDGVKTGYRYHNGSLLRNYMQGNMIHTVSKCISNGARISAVIFPPKYSKYFSEYVYTTFFDTCSAVNAIAVLTQMHEHDLQQTIRKHGDLLIAGMVDILKSHRLTVRIVGNGNLFQFIFPDSEFEIDFYNYALEEGLFFFRGDNQTLNACFTAEIVQDALIRFHSTVRRLAEKGYGSFDEIPAKMLLKSAFEQTEGCPEELTQQEKINFLQNTLHT